MRQITKEAGRLWSIVLAGGEGERTSALVRRWLGRHRPKQYCTFFGDRSLFQATVDRADRLAPASHRIVVAAPAHENDVDAQLAGRGRGKVIFQPANRGTAPGIFLPLSHVRAQDPDAIVAIYPSDHFVHPEERFVYCVSKAVRAVEKDADRVVLLGVVPDALELEYGWIEPDRRSGSGLPLEIRPVKGFVEKPDLERARKTMAAGGLWNTFVIVARARTLWELGWERLPDMMPLFEMVSGSTGTSHEAEILETVYRHMPALDMSKHLLQPAKNQLSVLQLSGILWSDWGRPERIAESLQRVGGVPAFPLEYLAAV